MNRPDVTPGTLSLRIEIVARVPNTEVRVSLINASRSAFWIRDELVFGGPLEELEDRNLVFKVVDVQGRSLQYQCLVEREFEKPVMRVLKPGERLDAQGSRPGSPGRPATRA